MIKKKTAWFVLTTAWILIVVGAWLAWNSLRQDSSKVGIVTSSAELSSSASTCQLPAYPEANCTGVPTGTPLATVEGDLTISMPNTVVDAKEIHGCVAVEASGVVIRRSKIIADCPYVIYRHNDTGERLLIENSEVSCDGNNGTAIGDTGIDVRRSNIYGCENGLDVDKGVAVEDSFIHDLTQTGDDPHTDGVQITQVGENVIIRHNTIYANQGTAAIITPRTRVSNILVQDNLLAGGAYSLYCRPDGSHDNFKIIDNHFSARFYEAIGAYGPWTDCQDETQVSGNVYHEGGLMVPL